MLFSVYILPASSGSQSASLPGNKNTATARERCKERKRKIEKEKEREREKKRETDIRGLTLLSDDVQLLIN